MAARSLPIIHDITPARKRAVKPATAQPSKRALAQADRHEWSHRGLYLTVGMSACLNAYANYQHAPMGYACVGAIALGIGVPCLIFILCKVAGMQYRSHARLGSFELAYFTAGVGVSLLVLSIYHCACSLALLSGVNHWGWCVPMAIAIDGGLIACELDLVLS